eukprot:scaffold89335_cov13-Tisochrysis_lutea.AAC.1
MPVTTYAALRTATKLEAMEMCLILESEMQDACSNGPKNDLPGAHSFLCIVTGSFLTSEMWALPSKRLHGQAWTFWIYQGCPTPASKQASAPLWTVGLSSPAPQNQA